MDIGENLKLFRDKYSLSRKKLSDLTGVSAGYIEEIESNKKTPTIEILLKIATPFSATVSELIGETEPQLTPALKTLVDNAKALSPEQLELVNTLIKNIQKG